MSTPRTSDPIDRSIVVAAPRFEQLTEPLGIGVATPRVSWKTRIESGDADAAPFTQTGYQLKTTRAGVVTLGEVVDSAEQVLVPWEFPALRSRESASVRVRVRSGSERWSDWSEPASVEAGLLEPGDWVAVPVGPAWAEDQEAERRPPLVRREFTLPTDIAAARLYVTAHGLAEVEINGIRIGRDALAPDWTVYGQRLTYRSYDVTGALTAGDNAIGAWLGDGWYRGRIGFHGGYPNLYGSDISLIAQLEVTHHDGRRTVVATDSDWSAGFGPILASNLYFGEHYDAREERAGWSEPGFDDAGFTPVAIAERDPATIVAPQGPPVRCTETLRPVSVSTSPSGATVLDFGQNLVGRLRIRVAGERGATVTLRHAEVMQDGEIYTRPLRGALATDRYTLAGADTEIWEPRFTFHGFRYAEITGWPGEFDPSMVEALVYHSDMERTGWLETSDPLINRLHENVVWGMRGNFVGLPTDCPQRDERLGWTGDIQVFAPTASFLYDCSGLLSSWLRDVEAEQLDDGTVPWYVPVIPGGAEWTPIRPGAVWGDVAVLTPWVLFERFADRGVIATQYGSAKRWVDLIDKLAGDDHLWNEGFQLGDWLDPAAPPHDPADATTDRYLVATAYFAESAKRLAETAAELGLADDAAHYFDLAAAVRAAFVGEYVLPSGALTSDAQTAYSLAIVFDLLPSAEQRSFAGKRLAELVREAGNRIATGFAGTPVISEALTLTGHVATAYDLLFEDECPSWLYTVKQGGTTIWERWDSLMPDGTVNPGGMTSFNHYALGAVADWMHTTIGGIRSTEPGFRRISVRPLPDARLSSASAAHESPYGRIEVSWRVDGDSFSARVVVPVGVTADIELLGQVAETVTHGVHEYRIAAPAAAVAALV
ncbi:glycoside hydrolase family 78 protein [Microterricola pindariensis]|uniref:alpha-L-rhamnosidase n=1 Tax=Microterricola pindariensis TaxID=478010 RepID=A0ABX5AVJ7_9MICO|nr:glycoside hydrolase family 78 protein [Microterricola pindariensis]PPL17635.1 alpha-L-rhamnosidase [Microterricola pindariensis]